MGARGDGEFSACCEEHLLHHSLRLRQAGQAKFCHRNCNCLWCVIHLLVVYENIIMEQLSKQSPPSPRLLLPTNRCELGLGVQAPLGFYKHATTP